MYDYCEDARPVHIGKARLRAITKGAHRSRSKQMKGTKKANETNCMLDKRPDMIATIVATPPCELLDKYNELYNKLQVVGLKSMEFQEYTALKAVLKM